jgi:hypothetical protein
MRFGGAVQHEFWRNGKRILRGRNCDIIHVPLARFSYSVVHLCSEFSQSRQIHRSDYEVEFVKIRAAQLILPH